MPRQQHPLLDGARVLACENGEVQFTDYGLSGICIMQLSGLLAPGRGPKAPAVELDLFPAVDETALASLFAAHAAQTAGGSAADFWLGLLNQKLGRTVWSAAGLQDSERLPCSPPHSGRSWPTPPSTGALKG